MKNEQRESNLVTLVAVCLLMLASGGACVAQTTSFLDNGTVKIGVDLTRGGAIHWFGQSGGSSVINIADQGRYVQQSYYSGPQPYGTSHPSWPNWGWNPIQAGDVYGNKPTLLAHSNNGTTIYTKCIPKQWALNNVDGECTFEQWTTLQGSTAKVRCRLNNTRSDTTWYGPRDQEIPAVYTIGTLYKLYTYTGEAPFTGGALTEIVNQGPPWEYWYARENWAAHVNASNWGLGIYTPGSYWFVGGFYGTKGSGGPTSSTTGYISPLTFDILDHNIVYEYEYVLILGNLTDIRNYVYANQPGNRPSYHFAEDRQRCYYNNTTDMGFPIQGKLRVKLDNTYPRLIGPNDFWSAASVPKLYIRMALIGTSATSCRLYYRQADVEFGDSRSVTFNAIADGNMRDYEINLAASPNYTGNIVQLRFQPTSGGVTGAIAEIAHITATKPPTGSVFINSGDTYTPSSSVTLTLSASGSSTITKMRFSNDDTNWTAWQTYATSKSWTLSSGSGTKHVYVQYQDAEGYTSLSCSDDIILDVSAPSVPTNVQAMEMSSTSIAVNWTSSTDDVGVASYRVFRNGSQVGTPTLTHFTDTNLTPGVNYSYTVSARDHTGKESAQSSPPVVASTSLFNFCSIDLGTGDVSNQLSRVAYSDGDTTYLTFSGLNCRRPMASEDLYFYFNIGDNFIYNGSVSTVYLEVCYYDDSGFIEPRYDSTSEVYKPAARVDLGGSNKWKTAVWTLDNCLFANRQNNGADFRLYVGQNQVKIDSVRVSRIPYSHHSNVSRTLGVNEEYRGLSHPQYTDGNTLVQLKEGVYCRRASSTANTYFYFNVSDAVMYDRSCPTVYLKVRYYDSATGLIRPEYDSMSGEYTSASTLNFAGSNTWKEHVWTLTNVKFANRQNASADFRLYVGTDVNVFIDRVTVSRVPFGDTMPPSVPSGVTATALTPSVIKVEWTASTDNAAVAGYRVFRNDNQVAVVATPGFTDTGLAPNTTYDYTVLAYDTSENESGMSSPAASATTMAVFDIAAVKELPDSSPVGLLAQVVTAIYADSFYVGAQDRSTGMKVVPMQMPAGLEVGSTVNIGGEMQKSNSGERYVGNATVIF